MKNRHRIRQRSPWPWPLIGVGCVGVLFACVLSIVLVRALMDGLRGWTAPAGGTVLRVAYSPEKAVLFTDLVKGFNAQRLRTPDGRRMWVEAVEMSPEAMIDAAVRGEVDAVTPDSSLWLDQIDRAWAATGGVADLVGDRARYAVSPVVLAMWENVARAMGYPGQSIGWQDIMGQARADPDFKWSHPSTSTASGLLATLAEFYAGAGITRGLTPEAATAESTLAYVGAIERTVRYYGEGELAVIERARREGPGFLDAFVVQEQLVIDFNREGRRPRLVAIYPVEGTLWADHPLALVEHPGLTDTQRLLFRRFRAFLRSEEAQRAVLAAGYRPANLSIAIDGPDSPIRPDNGVDPLKPQTTLQIPGPSVVEVVRDAWYYTKRKTNVYLVVDVSGSMEGKKLANAQAALKVFLAQIKGDQERVGLITFESQVHRRVPLGKMAGNRLPLEREVDRLRAGGDTALLDAVAVAYDELQQLGDHERINAIVAMTDGRENHSRISRRQLIRDLERGNAAGVPVVIFCIAYGDDADYRTLEAIVEATGGQVRRGDLDSIRELYKILSSYF